MKLRRGLYGNNYLKYYTKRRCENARVKNGKLINEAGKENGEVRVITLASLNTLGKRKMLYGSNEV